MPNAHRWLGLVALWSLCWSGSASAQLDPTMARALVGASTAQGVASASVAVVSAATTEASFEEPPAIVMRRSMGWIRGAAPVAAISWGSLVGWAAVGRPKSTEEGTCGGVLTPAIMAAPLVISTVLTVLGAARKRGLVQEGVTTYPLSRGRRTLRILTISAATTAALALGMGTLGVDSICFT